MPARANGQEHPLDGRRILVVDDEDDIRSLVALTLARTGADVVEARDGEEAIERFNEHEPALVILDAAMPRLDGWALLDRIRAVGETPVIMLTAMVTPAAEDRALAAGANAYLRKPFRIDDLIATTVTLLV